MHVLKQATQAGSAPPPDDGIHALTPRETEVLGLLARGHCTTEIARRLFLSPVTVRNHVQHLTAKLGLHSQLEAVAYAYRHDLVVSDLPPGPVPQPVAATAS